MKKSKKKKKTFKRKFKLFLLLLFFGAVIISLGYNLFLNIKNINNMKKEKVLLNDKITMLEKEKEELETDIMKLNDPEYIAKYVREKYFYSKDGEVILRIQD